MVAIDDNASMLCARVMRGTSSIAASIVPRAAIAFALSMAVSGSLKPMTS